MVKQSHENLTVGGGAWRRKIKKWNYCLYQKVHNRCYAHAKQLEFGYHLHEVLLSPSPLPAEAESCQPEWMDAVSQDNEESRQGQQDASKDGKNDVPGL